MIPLVRISMTTTVAFWVRASGEAGWSCELRP